MAFAFLSNFQLRLVLKNEPHVVITHTFTENKLPPSSFLNFVARTSAETHPLLKNIRRSRLKRYLYQHTGMVIVNHIYIIG